MGERAIVYREKNNITKEFATAKRKKLTTEVSIDNKRTGLLPTLSDNLPSIGEEINCIRANEATKTPNAVDPAWNVTA